MYNKNVRYSNSGYKLEWNSMTLIIGIKCRDGLVIGSDSKSVEDGYYAIKKMDCEKIHNIKNCLIAIAGNGNYADRMLEKIEKDLFFNSMENSIEFSKKFMDIIKGLHLVDFRGEYIRYKKGLETVENNKKVLDSMCRMIYEDINYNIGFDILFGAKTNNGFSLFKTGSQNLYPKPIKKYYPIGVGNTFAKYILNHIWTDDIDVNKAINIAIYVIEEVKNISNDVGGQTRVAIIDDKGTYFLPIKRINKVASVLKNKDRKALKFLEENYD